MPAKNSLKLYSSDSYYHIYNRGVEKRRTYMDEQDYGVFLGYLKEYLSPKNNDELLGLLLKPDISPIEREQVLKLVRLNNFMGEITLVAYCLMPNHFHFLIHQKGEQSIDKFMNSLGTRYTMYFNRKYKRVGKLWQGVYKAVLIESDAQLLELSRYIHKQAFPQGVALQGDALKRHQPCSYPEYMGQRKSEWVHPEDILKFFSQTNPKLTYESFMAQSDDLSRIEKLIVEDPYEL